MNDCNNWRKYKAIRTLRQKQTEKHKQGNYTVTEQTPTVGRRPTAQEWKWATGLKNYWAISHIITVSVTCSRLFCVRRSTDPSLPWCKLTLTSNTTSLSVVHQPNCSIRTHHFIQDHTSAAHRGCIPHLTAKIKGITTLHPRLRLPSYKVCWTVLTFGNNLSFLSNSVMLLGSWTHRREETRKGNRTWRGWTGWMTSLSYCWANVPKLSVEAKPRTTIPK